MRNMNIKTAIYSTVIILLSSCGQIKAPHQDESITMVEKPVLGNSTSNYVNNRLPLTLHKTTRRKYSTRRLVERVSDTSERRINRPPE